MSTIIKTIKDFFNNTVYPITKTNAVYDSNNNRLDNILASKQDASSNFVYKGTGSATPSIDDPELRRSDISTTQSTSDTTVPSSSLVKTMNDNLGNPSSASAVTGADAFSKISKLNSDLTNKGQAEEIGASLVTTKGADFDIALSKALSNFKSVLICIYGGNSKTDIYGSTFFPVFSVCPFRSGLDIHMRTDAATITGVLVARPFNSASTKMTFRGGNGVTTSQYVVIYGIK